MALVYIPEEKCHINEVIYTDALVTTILKRLPRQQCTLS